MKKVVIGSRGSDLALTQSNYIADQLRAVAPGLEVGEGRGGWEGILE